MNLGLYIAYLHYPILFSNAPCRFHSCPIESNGILTNRPYFGGTVPIFGALSRFFFASIFVTYLCNFFLTNLVILAIFAKFLSNVPLSGQKSHFFKDFFPLSGFDRLAGMQRLQNQVCVCITVHAYVHNDPS